MLAAAMAGPVQAKMAEVPAYNWSGFYIGGGGGVQVRVGRRIGDLTTEHEPELLRIHHRKNDVRDACFLKTLERIVDGALYL